MTEIEDYRIGTQALRHACSLFATGVAIVTTELGGVRIGMTINSFSSVSLAPPLVLWSLRESARCRAIFESAGGFVINILSAGQLLLARQFASGAPGLLAGCESFSGKLGLPIIPDALASIECATRQIHDAGDHRILIGEVTALDARIGTPLLFFNGRLSGGTIDADNTGRE